MTSFKFEIIFFLNLQGHIIANSKVDIKVIGAFKILNDYCARKLCFFNIAIETLNFSLLLSIKSLLLILFS